MELSTITLRLTQLKLDFFNRNAITVAKALLGKIIRHKVDDFTWLSAQIIETEAYYLNEKGSHASLGYTHNRRALFMPAGTIYMYYARGGDSLNVSCLGEGNAVLIKSSMPYIDELSPEVTLEIMQCNNPCNGKIRSKEKLCSGQTLLCKSLGLKVPDWNGQQFDSQRFYFADTGIKPATIIQTTRMGIPKGRDEHLLYRFIDYKYAKHCTKNPLSQHKPSEFKFLQMGTDLR